MDPSIMKILEDDEDETIHSGADLDAFTAALNRDIEGDASTSQPSDSDTGVLSHGSNPTSNQLISQWQNASQEDSITCQNQQELKNLQAQELHSSKVELIQHGSGTENRQQQIGSSQEHSQLPLQQNDDQLQWSAEHNPLQFSQKNGIQSSSEQNPVHFPEKDRSGPPDNKPQYPKLQKMNNQQALKVQKQVPFGLLLPLIVPHLQKDRAMQLDTLFNKLKKNEIEKDRFVRLMREIVGDQMLKQAISTIQMQAKAQAARNSQTGPHQYQAQSHTSSQQQQQVKIPSLSAPPFIDPLSFSLHQKGQRAPVDPSQAPTSNQAQTDSSFLSTENNLQESREMEHQSDSHNKQVSQMSSSSTSTVNQERDLSTIPLRGLQQASFPMYGSTIGNYHSNGYSGSSVGASATSLKSQTQDSQMKQVPQHQGMISTQSGSTTQPMNMMSVPKYDTQNSTNEPRRLHGGSLSNLTTHTVLQHNPVPWQSMNKEQKNSAMSSLNYVKQELVDQTQEQQHKSQLSACPGSSSFGARQIEQGNTGPPGTLKDETMEKQSTRFAFSTSTTMGQTNSVSGSLTVKMDPTIPIRTQVPSTNTSLGIGTNVKTPPKKPSIGQKKPLDSIGTPLPMASKKQKVSGAFLDQSIEQLNDVTAVSGVNLREEEEQLLSGPKEESRASEATRRAVQEEEERLILQKAPLQKKLAKIMSKGGIKNISNDVERCLSLCVEERMRGLISNLIRLSKQRVDIERPRHRTLITSDVRRQILLMNRKAKEEWDKKQAEEAEKFRKLNEAEGNTGADGEKDKDEGRLKTLKANKEEDDKMRTTAANVAARVAVGGDDMLSKWQLMAEQARQKREGGIDVASSTQLGKDATRRPSSISGRSVRENQDNENRGSSATAGAPGAIRKFGRNSVVLPHPKVVRSISAKDVIAVLEREPQMSKSTLVYRLYERIHADAAAE